MSLAMYLGFITGNLIAVIAAVLAIKAKRSKGQVEEDERTALIRAKTGGTAFYLSLGAAYVAWAAENIVKGMRGEAVHLFTPLGIVLCVMLVIWGASYFFHNRQFSADGDMTEAERKKQQQTGTAMLCIFAGLTAMQGGLQDRGAAEARALLIFLQLVLGAMAIKLIYGARKKAAH